MMDATFRVQIDGETHIVSKRTGSVYAGAQCDGCGQSDGLRVQAAFRAWMLICDDCGSEYVDADR